MFQCVSVIECQFIVFANVAKGDEPDFAFDVLSFAVGVAGMIGESGNVPVEVAIEVVLFVEIENVDGPFVGEL